MAMNTNQIATASPVSLLKEVFGLQPNQTLQEFLKECAPVKQDAEFIKDCRAYALSLVTE